MKKKHVLFVVFFAALVVAGAMMWTPVRKEFNKASIFNQENLPCFAIADTPKTRATKVSLLDVQVVNAKGVEQWHASFKDGVTISPSQCVIYGKPTDEMEKSTPATPLAAGETYSMAMGAPMPAFPYEASAYVVDFCILPKSKEIVVLRNQSSPCDEGGRYAASSGV